MPPNIREISPELAQVAVADFQETPERLSSCLEEIREWLQANPHVKPRLDDQFLVTFLRGCKYDMKMVKEKLESFYTVRTQLPEFFIDRNTKDERMCALLNDGSVFHLVLTKFRCFFECLLIPGSFCRYQRLPHQKDPVSSLFALHVSIQVNTRSPK